MSNSPVLPPRALLGDEARRAQCALREIHSRRGAMRELDAFAVAGEDDRVIADDIAAAQSRETDRARLALAGNTVADIHAVAGEVASERGRCRLAEHQRRARRRVDLVPVMHFDDLDIVVVAEALRGNLDQLGEHRDADAHVRREYDGDLARAGFERAAVAFAQAGGADHRRDAGRGAGRDVRQRAFRPREIDEHVGRCDATRDVGVDLHAGRATETFAGVASDERAGGDVERTAKYQVRCGEYRFDQRLPHAPASAGDGDADRVAHCPHQPIFLSHCTSQFSSSVLGAMDSDLSSLESPPPARAISTGGGGASSPSQRATLSSTK